jgi:hypothetical protein
MQELDLEIEFHGPFKLSLNGDAILFHNELSHLSGIYLMAIQYEEGYLAYYIGETGQSFFIRLKDHVIQYFGGNYRIYEPKKFKRAEKQILWNGMWRKGTRDRIPEFINRSFELIPKIKEFVQLLEIFIAPLKVETRIRQRIEGALSLYLKEQPPPIGTFQDEDIRYIRKKKNEKPIKVSIMCSERIHGLPKQLFV